MFKVSKKHYTEDEELNELLNKVYLDAWNDILAIVPQAVVNLLAEYSEILTAELAFYKENLDLVPYKGIMGRYINEIDAKEPTKSYVEKLEWAAHKTREEVLVYEGLKANGKEEVVQGDLARGS